MTETSPNRRKIQNVVVDPQAQLRLFVPFGLLFVLNVVMMVVMYRVVGNFRMEAVTSSTDLAMLAKLAEVEGRLVWFATTGILLSAVIALVGWLMYSHRIFGPIVPIRRQLASLIEGKYDGKVSLRKYDEFKSIADDLNTLTERLGARDA